MYSVLSTFWDLLRTLLVVGVLVFVHELGHFLAAKRVGIKVERFSIGFGPRLTGFTRGDTEYRISWFPIFGGYVKMAGENPAEEAKGSEEEEGQFLSAPVSHRAIVAAAGPGMNMIFAVFVVALAYMVGLPPDPGTVIGYVKPDSPASKAGIMPGDKVLSIDGYKIKTWSDIQENVYIHPNEEIQMTLLRNENQRVSLRATPTQDRREVLVSSIDLEFQSDLENEAISEGLREELEKNGISLSQDANVLVEETGRSWLITGGDDRYSVRREIALLPYSSSSAGDSDPSDITVVNLTVRRDGDKIQLPLALESEDRLNIYWEMEDVMIGVASVDEPIIGHIEPGSVAAEAGLRPDDVIEEVNHNKVTHTMELLNQLQHAGWTGTGASPYDARLISFGGLSFGKVVHLNPISAFRAAIPETIRMGGKIFQWLKRMIIGEVPRDKIAGPVGMVRITMLVLKTGMTRTLWFAGFLSINLGIVNLLPLFITDGAVITFLIVEKLRGKPMSRKRQLIIQQVGIGFIILLFLFLTSNDILGWIRGAF